MKELKVVIIDNEEQDTLVEEIEDLGHEALSVNNISDISDEYDYLLFFDESYAKECIRNSHVEIIKTLILKKDINAQVILLKSLSEAYLVETIEGDSYSNEEIIELIADVIIILSKENLTGLETVFLTADDESPKEIKQKNNLLSADDYQKIIYDWNATDKDYPKHKTIYQLFQEQVEKTPSNIAVSYADEEITYKKLNEYSNQLARYIRDEYKEKTNEELKSSSFVILCMNRSIEQIIAIFAILKAGGAYIPIDPDYPHERIKYIVEDSDAKLILSTTDIKPKLIDLTVNDRSLILLDDCRYEQCTTNNLDTHSGANDIAYVIYTSGTTGKPKGTLLRHQSLINLLYGQKISFQVSKDSIILQFASSGFDASISEIFCALTFGAKLVIVVGDMRKDESLFFSFMERQKISIATLPPALLENFEYHELPYLKTLVLAGEKCSYEKISTWSKNRRLINAYGPTEGTVCATTHLYKDGDLNTNIGKPINNVKTYVLDLDLNPVGIGCEGDLYIGGDCLAKGYLNQAELSSEKFISNPFNVDISKKDIDKIYKTGDLVRWLPQGELEYIGRNDDQVKIRGHRIELREIEQVITKYPGLNQCLVYTETDSNLALSIIAYYIADNTVSHQDLSSYLEKQLPDYMVPSFLMKILKIPLTINGKVDKKALPRPQRKMVLEENKPKTMTESFLVSSWEKLIKCSDVSRVDNFFGVGGHSLIVTKLISSIKKELNCILVPRIVYEHPVLKDLAEYIDKNIAEPSNVKPHNENNLKKVSTKDVLASSVQENMWNIGQYDTVGLKAYTIPLAIELSGMIDGKCLAAAIDDILSVHSGLKTRLLLKNNKLYQVQHEEKISLKIIDAEDNGNYHHLLQNEIDHTFDLSGEALIRPKFFQCSKNNGILSLVHHHAILDGFSIGLIISDICKFYSMHLSGNSITDQPKVKFNYIDYSAWLDNWISENEQVSIDFWQKNLPKNPSLTLPSDNKRQPYLTFSGNTISKKLSQTTMTQLELFSAKHNLSIFSVFLGSFLLLLSKYLDETDITIGIPFANRDIDDVTEIAGCFINSLPFSISLDESSIETTAINFFKQINQNIISLQEHQRYPVEKISEHINLSTLPGFNPLYQILFISEKFGLDDNIFNEFKVEQKYFSNNTAKVDISVYMHEREGVVDFDVEYNNDLYKEGTIQNLVTYYFNILEQITLNEPELLVKEINLISKNDLDKILNLDDDVQPNNILGVNLVEAFQKQVSKTPNNIAVTDENDSLSYQSLDDLSNQLSKEILATIDDNNAKNINNEVGLVAFYLERNMNAIISVLAILKSGLGYLALNHSYPEERLSFILKDSQATVLLTQNVFIQKSIKINLNNIPVINLDDKTYLKNTSEPLTKDINQNNLAYVIYTSGTTGQPKGVMCSHENLLNLAQYCISSYEINEQDKVAQFCSFSFDTFCSDWATSILSGAELILIPSAVRKDMDQLTKFIIDESISFIDMPTAVLKSLTIENLEKFKTLRYLKVGGEDLRGMQPLTNSPFTIINAYGPTECTVECLTYPINPKDGLKQSMIGKPIANLKAYVLDKSLSMVPPLIAGELYISGAGVSLGYLNRPDLTKENFIENPYATENDKVKGYTKLYKTGDLVKYLPSGNLEYIGRSDGQVKIRGHRIELREIEACLISFPSVNQSVVIFNNDKSELITLVAYIISNVEFDEVIIKSYLQEKLPDYMVPTRIIEIDKIPLTHNGKVDIKALPKANKKELSENEKPSTEVEVFLAQTWMKLLKITNISKNDSFFSLGGHSLLTHLVLKKIKNEYNCRLKAKDIYTNHVLKNLALFVDRLRSKKDKNEVQNIVIKPGYNLRVLGTPIQQGISLICNRDQWSSQAYTVPVFYNLHCELDVPAFKIAMDKLIERHEILRSRMVEENGLFYQVNDLDLGLFFMEENIDIINKSIQDQSTFTFNLETGPLFHPMLYKIKGQNRYILGLTHHHVIADGFSLQVLFSDLLAFYEIQLGISHTLPPLSFQYSDYSRWYYHYMQDDVVKGHIDYWKENFQQKEPFTLPRDIGKHNSAEKNGEVLSFELPLDINASVIAMANELHVSVFSTLLALFKLTIGKLADQQDACVGVPMAIRDIEGLESLVGCLINTLPISSEINNSETIQNYIKKVYAVLIDVQDHQHLYFFDFAKELDVTVEEGFDPFFQILVVSEQFDTPEIFSKYNIEDYSAHNNSAKYDLSLFIYEKNKQISFVIEFNNSLYHQDTINSLKDYFLSIIHKSVSNPKQLIGEISLLTNETYQKIVYDWNATEAVYPRDKTIHYLFEEQAKVSADKVALVYRGEKLTYKELNQQANKLARGIRTIYQEETGKPLTPDTIILLLLERGLEFIVGILAVFKAGGAYATMKYSKHTKTVIEYNNIANARIEYLIEDTKSRVLLVNDRHKNEIKKVCGDREVSILTVDNIPCNNTSLDNLDINVNFSDLAYILYTSGTSGKPKGVMIEHKSVINTVTDLFETYDLSNGSKVSLYSAMIFDVSISEIWATLLQGAELHILAHDVRINADNLSNYLFDQKINYAFIPPVMLPSINRINYPDLKGILYAGEPCDKQAGEYWSKQLSLYNLYGPTEATIYATKKLVSPDTLQVIGKPIINTKLYVLDSNLKPVPLGETGELYISGAGLARGYFNLEELSNEKFILNPFIRKQDDKEFYSRMYRTGDLVKWLPNGDLEYLGRNDFQIKIRGHRIELKGIETCLSSYPGIKSSIVIANSDGSSADYLIGYYVPEFPIDDYELRQYLKNELIYYMVPTWLIAISDMPIAKSGKIDRKALPKPIRVETLKKDKPETETEKYLSNKWLNLLKIDEIGTNENFFTIGATSIQIIKLVAMLNKKYAAKILVSHIYQHPTIKSLAQELDRETMGDYNPLTSLKSIKTNENLFLFHTARGSAEVYHNFSKMIDANVYGIESYNLYNDDLISNLNSLAYYYYRQIIQSVDKLKTPVLAGWSFGGVLALEVANLFVLNRGIMPTVILFDTLSPKAFQTVNNQMSDHNLKHVHTYGVKDNYKKKSDTIGQLFDEMIITYQPQKYKGDVILFKAILADEYENISSNQSNEMQAEMVEKFPDNGWGDVLENLKVINLNVSHEKMFSNGNENMFVRYIQDIIKPLN